VYYSENEIKNHIGDIFGVATESVELLGSSFIDSMVNTDNVLSYRIGSQAVICKMKSTNISSNLGAIIKQFINDDGFMSAWGKSPVFSLDDSGLREIQIYKSVDEHIKGFMPNYYGGVCDINRNMMFIENVGVFEENDTARIMDFLSTLHMTYYGKSEYSEKAGAGSYSVVDFNNERSKLSMMLESVAKNYKSFPVSIVEDFRGYLNDLDCIYSKVLKYGKTLCHGDFSTKNMKKSNGKLKVYDWELSVYFVPEFDLITYLVNSTDRIEDSYIEKTLVQYFNLVNFRNNKDEFYECIKLTSIFFFLERFIGVMILNLAKKLPYMQIAIDNYIAINNFIGRRYGK
jgi:hypothetical protein